MSTDGTSYFLTDAFVQALVLPLHCKGGLSASVDLPENVQSFVVTNSSDKYWAWVSFGTKDADLEAFVGVGHCLMPRHRLIVQKTPGVSKVAAIIGDGRGSPECIVYVECGQGGASESRTFRV